MKKHALRWASIAPVLVSLGCALPMLGGEPPTPTPQPTATAEPSATATAVPPTSTPRPTNTPMPTAEPKVTVGEFEEALEDAGYTAHPSPDGGSTTWVMDNWLELTVTSASGSVSMQVLNNVSTRLDHMEKKFAVMDGLFAADFMAEFRAANEAYAETVGAGVTGQPVEKYGPDPGDFLQFQYAYYNVSEQEIDAYWVRFSLLYMQFTCPEGYSCSIPYFGNIEFAGQASFTFYEVILFLAE
ncbi:MAG: hypothetical protein JW929_09405 [Anaerolineales bacterium]|nr:hypothetical protein [Anaerolineales bacterium]